MIRDKQSKPFDVKSILRPKARIELVFSMDNLSGQADIRQSMILDLKQDRVVIAQTEPPLEKSWLGHSLEASVTHRDVVTLEDVRWGWTAVVLSQDDDYILNPDVPAAEKVPVIGLSRPEGHILTRSNIRQAYRLDTTKREGIKVIVRPMPAPVRLVNFSVDGLMLAAAAPTPYAVGQELPFRLSFPSGEALPVYHIEGLATIVRLELTRDNGTAYLGLKFKRLKSEAQWALPKIVHYYMLEEQRKHHSGD